MRYFSIASLTSIVLATALITALYRHMAIEGITTLGQKINVELAHTALEPVKSHLLDYLDTVTAIDRPGMPIPGVGVELEQTVRHLMADTAVVRIKVYNRHGIVVFSTKPGQVGRNELEPGDRAENKGFESAVRGRQANKLIYRDTFNLLSRPNEDSNLMQTYLPLRRTATSPVAGVFEIYTDAQALVDYAQYTQIAVAAVTTAIMAVLYGALLIIVRRAEKIIASQQHTIRDRTETLELLSARLLTAQESEKKRLANALHEDVAQTLSAVKFQLEAASQAAGRSSPRTDSRILAPITSALQDAIAKVSAITMDLRPPSLDELGVVATLEWYLRQFQSHHPEIRLESDIALAEDDVSRPLKIIIYRIVQEVLENVARFSSPTTVRISLVGANHGTVLCIDDDGSMYQPGRGGDHEPHRKRLWFQAIEERAILSGGTVSAEQRPNGGNRIRFAWGS